MMHKFSLIVFDWDGTLMDSASSIVECLQLTIEEMELEPLSPAALRDIIGLGLSEAIAKLYPDMSVTLNNEFISIYRKHFLSEARQAIPLFPGARATLETLNLRGYLMAVATGKSRRGLNRSLQQTDCDEFFHMTRCADESFSKPHPQMLFDIMDVLNVSPEMTLMIGDSEYDMLMAKQAGTAALAVDYGVHDRRRLQEHQPIHCISDISELSAWLP